MKKEIVSGLLVLLVAITVISVMRESDVKSVATDLQNDNDRLARIIADSEKKLDENSTTIEDLREENQLLAEKLAEAEKEVAISKTAIEYKEFLNALQTVESYKAAKTFQEASEFIALKIGNGFGTMDSKGTCPCSFDFNRKTFDWIPNAVQELKEFSIEGEKIILTFYTSEEMKHDYQFVMIKAPGMFDMDFKWRIEEITLKGKDE